MVTRRLGQFWEGRRNSVVECEYMPGQSGQWHFRKVESSPFRVTRVMEQNVSSGRSISPKWVIISVEPCVFASAVVFPSSGVPSCSVHRTLGQVSGSWQRSSLGSLLGIKKGRELLRCAEDEFTMGWFR